MPRAHETPAVASTETAAGRARDRGLMQIGEAADRVGLSIRTLRHYEEVGIVAPSARSDGGFRLYTQADLDRLALVKPMKPLGFTLEEMRVLLSVLDTLRDDQTAPDARLAALERLAMFQTVVSARIQGLQEQLAVAQAFAQSLDTATSLKRTRL